MVPAVKALYTRRHVLCILATQLHRWQGDRRVRTKGNDDENKMRINGIPYKYTNI
jgi:hypothetical protein